VDSQLPVKSVPITTKAVSSNPAQGELYSMQHYVIDIVNDLRQVVAFLRYSNFLIDKTDHPDINDILLKVALNTITSDQQVSELQTNTNLTSIVC